MLFRNQVGRMLLQTSGALALLASNPTVAQENNLACGRAPMRYGIVLDPSSSLQSDELRQTTEQEYLNFVRIIQQARCVGDSLDFFAFPRERGSDLIPIVHRQPDAVAGLRREIRTIRSRGIKHTDYRIILERIELQMFPAAGSRYDAVFLLTDGSLFPYDSAARATPSDFADEVAELSAFAESFRLKNHPLFVVGINSHVAKAVDPDATKNWSGADWQINSVEISLDAASGSDLMRLLFEDRFVEYDQFSLEKIWFGEPGRVLLDTRGYQRFDTAIDNKIDVQHVIVVPEESSRDLLCPSVSRASYRRFRMDVQGQVACFYANPSASRLSQIMQSAARYFVLQKPHFDLSQIPDTIYGLHQLVASTETGVCSLEHVLSHLRVGKPWPSQNGERAIAMLIPAPGTDSEKIFVPLHALTRESPCLVVPGVEQNERTIPLGNWVVEFSQGSKKIVKQINVRAPLAVQRSHVAYSGGLPFMGTSRSVRVISCAGLRPNSPVGSEDYQVVLTSGNRHIYFTRTSSERCGRPGWAISDLFILNEKPSTGLLKMGSRGDEPSVAGQTEWFVVSVPTRNGFFFLPFFVGVALFTTGTAIEALRRYLHANKRVKRAMAHSRLGTRRIVRWRYRARNGESVSRSRGPLRVVWESLSRRLAHLIQVLQLWWKENGVSGSLLRGYTLLVAVQIAVWAFDTNWIRIDHVSFDVLAEISFHVLVLLSLRVFPGFNLLAEGLFK